ncbi:MAG TPA: hypothetical protein VFE42_20675 [Chloroflexota bacterium]|nr:hypothetical protein [Chloroflexota bacterium]HZS89893.1 hypothetical protein [Chloroflexota bacterium]
MARQYVMPADFLESLVGAALNQPAISPGLLAKQLCRASARVDRYCLRKFGLPGSTTVRTAAAAGSATLELTSILNIDGDAGMVLVINAGGATQEQVQIAGYAPPDFTTPGYPATVSLVPGTTTRFAHNAGEPVQAYYYEQYNAWGGATSKMDQYFDFTQQGQIAEAHAPRLGIGENVRTVFLKNMPIVQIYGVAIVYPWANVQDIGVPGDLRISTAEGWYNFPIGWFDPQDSLVITTYLAGFQTVPDDVQDAVIYETAAAFGFGSNPLGLISARRGDGSATFATSQGRNLLCQQSYDILESWVNPAPAG